MAGLWVSTQAIAWWNMVGACEDAAGSATNTINCVWGVVTTVITASGAIYSGYIGSGRVSTWLNNNGVSIGGFKRSEPSQELLDEFSAVFGAPVTHLGYWNYETNGSSIDARSEQQRDVFGFNSNGMDLHFSYLHNQTNGPTFRMGFGNGTTTTTTTNKRAQTFDTQYFASGGADFVLFDNSDLYDYPSGGPLNTSTDYTWIYDQVSCYMASTMSAAGNYFQLYDNVHQDTISAGAIAPFSGVNHWSAITQMESPDGGLSVSSTCDPTNTRKRREFRA